MTGEVEFAVVILLLYAFECVVRLRAGDLLIAPSFTGRYKTSHPAPLSGGSTWGWSFLWPWPGQPCFSSAGPQVAITAHGILVPADGRGGWTPVEFTDIPNAHAMGDRAVLNGRHAVPCLSATEARDLSEYVVRLRRATTQARARIIREHTAKSFDEAAVRTEVERFRTITAPLRRLSIWMFVNVFFVFPLISILGGFGLAVLFFVTSAFVTSICAGVLHHKVHPKLDPAAPALERWMATLHVALYPLAVIRCTDALSLRLLRRYEAVTIAFAVQGREAAEDAARKLQVQIQAAGTGCDDPQCAEILEQYRTMKSNMLDEFLERIGCNLEHWNAPPAQQGPDCRSYCPRCLTQYQLQEGTCGDCGGGVVLRPLTKAQ